MNLFSNTMNTIEQALNYSSLKQKVISQNIANVDTPGYKAKDVQFKDQLQNEIQKQLINSKRSDERHFTFSGKTQKGHSAVTRLNTSYNNNENSVDLDKEMADLATNQIYYNAMIDRMNGKFNSLKTVIRGGK